MSSASRAARYPPPLAPGARVALIAPAGPLATNAELDCAVANARALGWEPVIGASALARQGYLAGSDRDRLADLNGALADRSIDGIWCLRGGYGCMRVLDGIDYDALRRRPKAIIGYSDITALHLALAARARVVSFHGPTARGTLTEFSRDSLARAVAQQADACGVAATARVLRGGRASGRVIGGNLALVSALVGTPYAAELEGAVLVLEDVNEPVYRIDRMVRQLRLSGALGRCSALLFGAFTERGVEDDENNAAALHEVLAECADVVRGPVLSGVPVGHVADQWTLALGARCEVDADECRVTLPAA